MNVRTIGDLRAFPLDLLERMFGAPGRDLHERCRGRDTRPVDPREVPLGVSRETAFPEPVTDPAAVESMLYRTGGLIDAMLAGSHANDAVLAALEEFAIEASILKVASSEMIDFAVDENVQIHGGNGYTTEFQIERDLRDAIGARIYSGTSEIQRTIIARRMGL